MESVPCKWVSCVDKKDSTNYVKKFYIHYKKNYISIKKSYLIKMKYRLSHKVCPFLHYECRPIMEMFEIRFHSYRDFAKLLDKLSSYFRR